MMKMDNQTVTTTFRVSPSFPLALHTKLYKTATAWSKYTLVEASGF